MARSINRLSARGVQTETRRGLHCDGGGLYLQVSRFDTKSWVFRFTLNGKAREMGLGSLQDFSLSDARQEAERCRRQVRDGIDPIEDRKLERARRRIETAKTMTFQQCAEAYIRAQDGAWRNLKHANQWTSTLKAYVYPIFGDLPVQVIDIGLVTKALDPIWRTKTETASRVRGRIEAVLDWAAVNGHRSKENPARWKGRLDKVFPSPSKLQKVKHHAALPYLKVGAFIADLRKREATAARGLDFLILTAARTAEVVGAQWSEIDFGNKVWTVPADRMKGQAEHRVPLSADALAVLEQMKEVASSGYIFPGAKKNRPLSNMAFLKLLERMGRDDLTAHGFRSTFRDWAAERTNYPREVAEMALAHVVENKVEAAYRRGDLFEKRRRLMADWATFCATVPADSEGDKVVALRA